MRKSDFGKGISWILISFYWGLGVLFLGLIVEALNEYTLDRSMWVRILLIVLAGAGAKLLYEASISEGNDTH